MLSRLMMALLALQAAGSLAAQGADWLALCERGALAEQACIGALAERCRIDDGARTTFMAGPCFGDEAAMWQARLDAAMTGIGAAAALASDWAAQVGWPDPQPTLARVAEAFAAHRAAACDMEGALWGNGAGAGETWAECRMQVTAQQAVRLESRVEVTR